MIDLKQLTKNKELYIKGFSNKNMELEVEINEAIKLYDFYLNLLNQ